MTKIDVAGLKVDALTKTDLLREFSDRLRRKQKTFVVTPYSEFLYESLRQPEFRDLLNRADFSLPDGIAIVWAAKYLSLPLTLSSHFGRTLQAWWQIFYTGAAIIFSPAYVRSVIPQKITGSDLIWDIAALAAKNGHSIYLLGGFGDTAQRVADELTQKFPGLRIAGYSSRNPNDSSTIPNIQNTRPDILLVAYGPVRQEQWIGKHLSELPASLVMGVGGTFDYVAGVRKSPPPWVRNSGLEWLYRLFTQPHRIGRIFNATVGLITALARYKVSKKTYL